MSPPPYRTLLPISLLLIPSRTLAPPLPAHGFVPPGEEPGDPFEEAAFPRIRTVRDWLGRCGLEDVLR